MATKKNVTESAGIYFITFTCCKWLPLFDMIKGHDVVYNWFNHLKANSHHVLGYVIMPNHVHVIIAFSENKQGVNKIVSNGKRFMAYEIVARLKENNHPQVLESLAMSVSASDCKRGKLHQVFESSFDCKECRTKEFIWQKLNYIHQNPVRGKWMLAVSAIDYLHSSAKYYYTQKQGIYTVLNFLELNDMEWAGKNSGIN